jgi:hypothetical protein
LISNFQIITKVVSGDGLDPKPILDFIMEATQTGQCELINIEDSIFVLINLAPQQVGLHLFSQNSPVMLGKNILAFHRQALKRSISKVYIHDENPRMTKLLHKLGFVLEVSDRQEFDWVIDPKHDISH